MRGKDFLYRTTLDRYGITPAYAGKSCAAARSGRVRQDHPRICGEKSTTRPETASFIGSPPHMRGKASCFVPKGQIPEDHPRICGEKDRLAETETGSAGSPPHMRGKVYFRVPLTIAIWITPAYAGKSRVHQAARPALRDHPRICGEKFCRNCLKRAERGSPPHMRGKALAHRLRAG